MVFLTNKMGVFNVRRCKTSRSQVEWFLDTTLHIRKLPNFSSHWCRLKRLGNFRIWRVVSKNHSTCDRLIKTWAPGYVRNMYCAFRSCMFRLTSETAQPDVRPRTYVLYQNFASAIRAAWEPIRHTRDAERPHPVHRRRRRWQPLPAQCQKKGLCGRPLPAVPGCCERTGRQLLVGRATGQAAKKGIAKENTVRAAFSGASPKNQHITSQFAASDMNLLQKKDATHKTNTSHHSLRLSFANLLQTKRIQPAVGN